MRLESINYSAKTHYFLLAGRQGSSMSMSNQADASMSKWFALLILAIQTFSHTSNWTRIISLAWESVCYAVYQFRPFRNSFGIPTSRDYGWRMEGGEGATKTQVSKWARRPKSPSTKFKEPHWYSDGKNIGPRWREIASLARGSQDARSRNLGPTFFTVPVVPHWDFHLSLGWLSHLNLLTYPSSSWGHTTIMVQCHSMVIG